MRVSKFVILSIQDGRSHSAPTYWRPGKMGYTQDLDEAGIYSWNECVSICGGQDIPIPLSLALYMVEIEREICALTIVMEAKFPEKDFGPCPPALATENWLNEEEQKDERGYVAGDQQGRGK